MKKIICVMLMTGIIMAGVAFAIPSVPDIPPIPSIVSTGTTYHVDRDTGSNNNDGTYEHPWKTLQYSFDQLTPGDTLIIHESSTGYNEWVTITSSGSSNNWITIKGADNENVELSGGRITFDSDVQYISFTNFYFNVTDAGWTLLALQPNAHHLAFDNIEVNCNSSTANYTGVSVREGVNNIWFRNMDVHHCGYKKTNPTDGSGFYMMRVYDTDPLIDNITFKNVTVRDNKGDGIGSIYLDTVYFDGCISTRNSGDGFDIGAQTLSIFKNTVSSENGNDQGYGFKIWSQNAWIVNSLVFNNAYTGVVFKPKTGGSNIYIYNSTFARNSAGEFYDPSGYGTNNVYLYNNIFFTDHVNNVTLENTDEQTLAGEDNNYFFSNDPVNATKAIKLGGSNYRSYTYAQIENGTWFAQTGNGEYDIGKIKSLPDLPDPGFADLTNNNYTLAEGSLAIDAGVDVGLSGDHDGTPVPCGPYPDMGAYEYCLVSNGGLESQTDFESWTVESATGVTVSIDQETTYSGARSAKVVFNNASTYSGLYQDVVNLDPYTTYKIEGYVKTQLAPGENNPRAGILVDYNNGSLADTQFLSGTHDWTYVEAEFTTSSYTTARVKLYGHAGSGTINGTAWWDHVTLYKLTQ